MEEFRELVDHLVGQRLRDKGFRLVGQSLEGQPFGNAALWFESPGLRIRVSRDRYQILAGMAAGPNAEPWWNLDVVALALGVSLPLFPDSPNGDLDGLAELFDLHWSKVVSAFGPDYQATQPKLLEAQRKRSGWLLNAMRTDGPTN